MAEKVLKYQDHIGTFAIKDAQKLISVAKASDPVYLVKSPTFTERVKFGAAMKEKHFHLDNSWAYLNHGAFGAALKEGLDVEREWQIYCERQPTKFIDRELLLCVATVQKRLGKFIDVDPTDIALVPNASTGTCTVVQRMIKKFQPGDSILTLSTTYGAVKMLLDRVNKEDNVRVDELDVKFPMKSTDEVVEAVKNALKSDTKLAIFDHVPSTHAVIMPVKKLVEVCHERGIPVLIDGAHCLGSLPISIREIGADFYVANAHKWLCSPKGCAVLYVAKQYQSQLRPLVVSWGYNSGFNAEFGWTGLRDYAPYLSLTTVLDFWEFYGPENIQEYMYKTARDAGKLLKDDWGTSLLADPSMFGTMVVVELPDGLLPRDLPNGVHVRVEPPYEDKSADLMQDILHYSYKVEVPVKCIGGKLYVRISAHIYNEMKDYERLAEAVLEQRKEIQNTKKQ